MARLFLRSRSHASISPVAASVIRIRVVASGFPILSRMSANSASSRARTPNLGSLGSLLKKQHITKIDLDSLPIYLAPLGAREPREPKPSLEIWTPWIMTATKTNRRNRLCVFRFRRLRMRVLLFATKCFESLLRFEALLPAARPSPAPPAKIVWPRPALKP